ncbi:MAG: hypothetical protein K5764_10015 [Prevotella sp.]|nr:hypothetical protein [Prevotella sp.]
MMLWVLGSFLGTFVGETSFFLITDYSYDHALQEISYFFGIFLTIFIGVALTTFLPQKKRERQMQLMLPATNLEKWLAALFNITVVWTLSAFLAFVLGDTLRMVVSAWLFDQPWLSGVPKLLHFFIPFPWEDHISWQYLILSYLMLVWLHSWYVLGGSFFRRYAFILQSVLLIIGCICLFRLFNALELPRHIFRVENGQFLSPVWGYSACMFLICCSVLNYWLSFHIFKNYELTTNNWTNYDIFKR